jgi:GT2 family glycosyltransferase
LQLSIIIVNYNAGKFITDCINSTLQFSSAKEFEWIIVDNNSSDGSKSSLLKTFPFIKWIDMNYNAGFARANNAGIKVAAGNIILLLNPDTIIIDDCIDKCLQRFINDNAIACSPQLINTDRSPQITGNYFMKGGLNHLLPLPYLGKLLRSIAFLFKAKKTNVLAAATRQKVDWINGAFLMVKKSVIEKAGLMDEDFFLYAEESEWCSRLKKFGDLVVYGDLKIIHLQGEIINAETASPGKGYFNLYDKKGLQLIVSNNLRIRKQYGIGWYLFNLIIYLIEIPVFFICSFFNNLIHLKNPFYNWRLINGFTKNVFILVKLSPMIITLKKYFYKML